MIVGLMIREMPSDIKHQIQRKKHDEYHFQYLFHIKSECLLLKVISHLIFKKEFISQLAKIEKVVLKR